MSTTRYETQPFAVGDRIVFSGEPGSNLDPSGLSEFQPGDVVEVTEVVPENKRWGNHCVKVEGSANVWNVDWFDKAEQQAQEAPERPLVDFSGPSRKTAREYAAVANSRVLNEESRKTLDKVQRGGKVDAYDLNEAVLDAMRSATTRCGQSMARRDLATKVAYLGHITQAVLENHADNLPAYDSAAARSRLVQELRAKEASTYEALKSCEKLLEQTRAEVDENHHQAVAEGAQLADRLQEQEALNHRLIKTSEERDTLLTETIQERGTIADVLQYAIGRLPAVEQQRVLGYWDGVKQS